MIHFNVPPYVGTELKYIEQAIKNHKICEMALLQRSVMNGWKDALMLIKYY